MTDSAQKPLVSVLIPLYNHEPFIEKTLESVVSDSYPNTELIVIDDGSKDGSYQTAKRWQEEHGHRFPGRFEIRTRENRGVSATLNELFDLSRGDYIAYLSSDDYLLPGGIAARLEYLEAHPRRMLVVGDFHIVDYEGNETPTSGIETLFKGDKRRLANERLLPYEIVFNWCLAGPIYMGRRELYQRLGGYNEKLTVEDWDFCLRLVADDLLGFVDHPIAAYRVRPDDTPTVSREALIKYNEAMYLTAHNNLPAFTGLKWAFLYFNRLTSYGILQRLKGRSSVKGFLARKVGRIMVALLKWYYRTWAKGVLAR